MSNLLTSAPATRGERVPVGGRPPYGPASMLARNWIVDLRRRCFFEMGGTSRPKDIWNSISCRIESEEITARGFPVVLRPAQEWDVRQAARHVVANCVTDDFRAVI